MKSIKIKFTTKDAAFYELFIGSLHYILQQTETGIRAGKTTFKLYDRGGDPVGGAIVEQESR